MLMVLIKPVSGSCNLACTYCFYHDITSKRLQPSAGVMSLDTLELLVQKALSEANRQCTFGFQGGEPMLAGLPFYEKLIAFQQKYNYKNLKILNTVQTNGTCINDQWAAFFRDNHFLVGVSLDGGKALHDQNRLDKAGKGSYTRVMRGLRSLEQCKVPYNILCVVSAGVAKHAQHVYSFFRKNGFQYLQFIPCLDPLGVQPGQYPHSLTPQLYGAFLDTLFHLWYQDVKKGELVSIRFFDNLLLMAMGYAPESCDMQGSCQSYFLVEADGAVYPCDFYVLDEWKIGHLTTHTFAEMQSSEPAVRFREIGAIIGECCKACKHYFFCRGGCRRNREPILDSAPGNYFCDAYKQFFDRHTVQIKELATILGNQSAVERQS